MQSLQSTDPHALLVHQDFVRGLARSLLFDDHEVDDLVQQTWLVAMRGGPRDPGAIRSWLSRVVRSRASNLRRDRTRQQRRETEAARQDRVPVPTPAEIAERESCRSQLVAAVMQLREPYRSTVLLRYFENLSPTEIARQEGIPGATVRTRLKRALTQLREELDQEHGGDRQAWCLGLVPLASGRRWVTLSTALCSKSLLLCIFAGVVLWGGWTLYQAEARAGLINQDPAIAAAAPTPDLEEQSPASPEVSVAPPGRRAALVSQNPDDDPRVRAAQVGFSGRLVDPEGRPAAGRDVEILAFEPNRFLVHHLDPWVPQGNGLHVQKRRARSDAQGRFAIRGIWPRSYFLLRSDSRDRLRAVRVLAHSPAPGQMVELGDVTLEAVASLRGRVVDQDGEPVRGALIWSTDLPALILRSLMAPEADPQGGMIVHRGDVAQVYAFPPWTRRLADICQLPTTRSDAQGRFELEGMQAGGHVLVVHSAGHAVLVKNRVRLKPSQQRDLGDLRLRSGEEAYGLVLNTAGEPVPGAEVMVAPRGVLSRTSLFGALPKIAFARRARRCDAEGRFSVGGLPRSALTLAFRRSPRHAWLVEEVDSADQEIRLRLPKPVGLRLQLQGIPSGVEPRLKLIAGHPRGELLLQSMVPALPLDFRLERPSEGVYKIKDLDPGTYTLLVEAPGVAFAVHRLDTSKAVWKLHHRRGVGLQVTVRDPAGKPLPAARVYLRPVEVEPWQRSVFPSYADVPHWRVLPSAQGHSDGQGQAELDGLVPGSYQCTVAHPELGSLTQAVEVPGETVQLRFAHPGSLVGRLLDRDKPAAAGKWMLCLIRRDGVDREAPLEELITLPAADGRFGFEGLLPGEYRLLAYPAPVGVRSIEGIKNYLQQEAFGLFNQGPRATVQITAGAQTEADLNVVSDFVAADAAGAAVTGVAFLEGRPLAGMKVLLRSKRQEGFVTIGQTSSRFPVKADGSFDLGRTRPGKYTLEIQDSDKQVWASRAVEVKDGQPQQLRIQLRSARLAVILRDAAGRPAVGASLKLQGSAGEVLKLASGAGGRALLERVPVGTYRIEAEHDRLGFGLHQGLKIEAGADREVALALGAWRKFSGKIEAADFGVEEEGASVTVYTTGKSYQMACKKGRFSFSKLPGLPLRVQVMGRIIGKQNHYRVHPARVLAAGVERSTRNKAGWPVLELSEQGLEDCLLRRFHQ